jgi:DNA-binding MarR family transcriptional regulator
VLLQTLERDGQVTRAAEAAVGKAIPTRLTPRGRALLDAASAAVRSVEDRMLSGMTPEERTAAFGSFQSMIRSLRAGEGGVDGDGPRSPPSR